MSLFHLEKVFPLLKGPPFDSCASKLSHCKNLGPRSIFVFHDFIDTVYEGVQKVIQVPMKVANLQFSEFASIRTLERVLYDCISLFSESRRDWRPNNRS